MKPVLVIGLLPNADRASLCLSNLAEADFEPNAISLVLKRPSDVATLANVSGPWNAIEVGTLVAKLTGSGLTASAATVYREGVLHGEVFIAINAGEATEAAREMLADHAARAITTLQVDGEDR